MNTKSYKVVIDGQEYNLVSDEGQMRIEQAARLVDNAIQELSAQAPKLDRRKVTVLAMLQVASELLQIKAVAQEQHEKHGRLASLINETLLSL